MTGEEEKRSRAAAAPHPPISTDDVRMIIREMNACLIKIKQAPGARLRIYFFLSLPPVNMTA